MPLLRSLALKIAGATPSRVKAFVYRHPALLTPLAAFLKRLVPAQGEVIVRITSGPNVGLNLVVDRSVPNYFWLNPDYEPAVQEAISAALRPGLVAADIGAHMGFDTLHMARLVGPTGHVHAFEPDPANACKLRRNCELNAFHQVTCHAVAVADRTGTVSFQASGTTTSHVTATAEIGTLVIPAVTLDEIMARSPDPQLALVKIDVEGAELNVLQGAPETLRLLRPVLLMEIHSAQNLADCGRLLIAAGYRLETLTPGDYYADALARLARGTEPPATGFDVGHIRAVPVKVTP